jgi:hypothetical protein
MSQMQHSRGEDRSKSISCYHQEHPTTFRQLISDQMHRRTVEQGSHRELIALHGYYAVLCRRKAGGLIDNSPQMQAAE